jgi:hypothetical protein
LLLVTKSTTDYLLPIGFYAVHIRFTNVAQEPLIRVVFALDDGMHLTDVGKFSLNVQIDHTFFLDPTNATSCTASFKTVLVCGFEVRSDNQS